jgi:hypothetical protein
MLSANKCVRVKTLVKETKEEIKHFFFKKINFLNFKTLNAQLPILYFFLCLYAKTLHM